jgi:hypothetical protein
VNGSSWLLSLPYFYMRLKPAILYGARAAHLDKVPDLYTLYTYSMLKLIMLVLIK